MRRHPCLLLPLCLALLPALPAQASSQLALEQGCYSCHGEPPRRGIPSMAELAADYARYRGQADAPRRLADKLREGTLFGHIAAHERLSPEECEALMRWLIDGAP
jgi:cytochrome c